MERFILKHKIPLLTFAVIFILSLLNLSKNKKPYPAGDAIEYTIMTEALFNHGSPDVRADDFASFKRIYERTKKWESNPKGLTYDEVQAYVARTNLKLLDYNYAFFTDKKGAQYSCHFFAYSLVCVPVRAVCSFVRFNPLLVAPITNILLILITCFVFLRTSKFGELATALFTLIFFYSAQFWYMDWHHPEVFTSCLLALGLWRFIQERFYSALFLVALAALQNQPIALLLVPLTLIVLFAKGINISNLLKITASVLIVVLPALFYFYHFGVTNLISYQGALSASRITFTRVFGLFFDINQGAILGLPLLLPVYLFFIGSKMRHIKLRINQIHIAFFLSLILCVCAASTINNWNHGQAVVNRYAVYISAAILVHLFFLVNEWNNEKKGLILLAVGLLTQLSTIYYHQKLTKYDWSSNQPKPFSNWMLDHLPSCYNPDPIIFQYRYAGERGIMDPGKAPVYFMKKNGKLAKLMVHKDHVEGLQLLGISEGTIEELKKELSFQNDWAYVPLSGKVAAELLPAEKLKVLDAKRRVGDQIEVIKRDPAWLELVNKKAEEQKISVQEAMENDACYILLIDPKMIRQ